MIRLYQTPECPFCHRVRIALTEKGLDYQIVPVDFSKKENRTEQFLRLNPLGQLPVLSDDDLVLSDSLVINEYLNEEYPYPELLPEDSQERAQIRNWSQWINQLIADPFFELYLADAAQKKGEAVNLSKVEQAKSQIALFLNRAEQQLKGKEFLVGNYSLADIAFAPFVSYFEQFKVEIPASCENVKVWFKRLNTRNAIVKTR